MKFRVPHFDLVELEADLSVLKKHLDFVEEQMTFQSEKSEHELNIRLTTSNYDPEDPRDRDTMGDEYYYHQHWVSENLPRLVVNPFIVALWSVFESVVKEMADLIQKKQGEALGLADIKGKHLVDRIEKYYQHILHFPLDLNSSRKEKLNLLGAIRNTIAHHNGRLDRMSSANQKAIREGNVDGISESSDGSYLVIEVKYARSAFELIEQHLRMLFDRYGTL